MIGGILTVSDFVVLNVLFLLIGWCEIGESINEFFTRQVWFVLNVCFVIAHLIVPDMHSKRVVYADKVVMNTLRLVKKRMNPNLEIFGVALTMFDGRTNFSNQVAQEVRRHFPGKVFATVIPRNVRLAEAPSHGLPVTVYDKYSRGAEAYKAMAEEIKKKI